ncbi:hypothetical protein PR202_gb24886 [Eleusine coracana subsp. coracana]|uniref:PDZ domain-containing protein n=1 Tax=Eleusine coracana subsp. coracana TaxID=191504 RepID=A0AAV5FNN9_ELECO|nr:hypothetical protein PR202_gb24886 [Eleusine coracana subsp. coracana]
MARTTTQEEGEEGSGSPSRARGWRRRTRSGGPSTSTAPSPSREGLSEPTASSERSSSPPNPSRVGRSEQRASSHRRSSPPNPSRAGQSEPRSQRRRTGAGAAKQQRKKKEGSRAAGREQSKKRKRTRAADEGEEIVPRRSKRRSIGVEAVAASGSAATEQASSSETSSAVSSPLRAPYIHREVIGVNKWGRVVLEPFIKINPAIVDTFGKHEAKHFAKRRNQLNLVTLDENVPRSRLKFSRFESIHDHESVTEMFLKVAKVVFGLSSYIDGNLLKRTSGFLIEWDKNSKIGTILTSAFLICSKSKSFDDDILGTDEYSPHAEVHAHLLDKHDTVVNAELIKYHKHYNFALYKIKIDTIAGIPPFSEAKFGQKVFVLGRDKNMHLSIDSGCVLRKGPSSFQQNHYMFASCEINQVSEGSVAEEVGIRNGDVIMCWNGESVSTTVELESILLHMSEDHLENGGGIGSTVDIPVGMLSLLHIVQLRLTLMMTCSDTNHDVESAGQLEDGPFKDSAILWRALMGACSFHKNSEVGRYAAEKLLLFDTVCTAAYVLLSNIYSSDGRWEDRARVLKKMREMGLKKDTGKSCRRSRSGGAQCFLKIQDRLLVSPIEICAKQIKAYLEKDNETNLELLHAGSRKKKNSIPQASNA